jgi:hypothetical protein
MERFLEANTKKEGSSAFLFSHLDSVILAITQSGSEDNNGGEHGIAIMNHHKNTANNGLSFARPTPPF